MKLIVFSSAPVINLKGNLFLYAPYEHEKQIWARHVDEIQFCSPVWNEDRGLLVSELTFSSLKLIALYDFSVRNLKEIFGSVYSVVKNILIIFKAMQQADHIHLRCPGNIGLLACVIQILFPYKPKTAKYAGNWDPKAKQPWSYRLQKWILSNTFLTKNIKVLVYGEWENQSKNIHPFFTASYSENEEKTVVKAMNPNGKIRLLFVGTLVEGKNPLYAIQLLQQLKQANYDVQLDIYGDGPLRPVLQNYIEKNNLKERVFLHGNHNQEVLKNAYQQSHFVILPSKSEGWPKAIAEAMFWGAVPLATAVSCVPYMLDYGNRGVLLVMNLDKDAAAISELIKNPLDFTAKSIAAINWSRAYTLERFETEIQKMLQV